MLKLPSNPNLFYTINPKPSTLMVMPRLLIQELSTKGTKEDHTLVFCHSYVLLSLYQTTVLVLGSQDALYIRRKSITSEKDDTCTTLSVRKNITSSLDSALRVCFFFSTIAFSIGLDSPNIRKVIHEQESGRSGRDGEPQ